MRRVSPLQIGVCRATGRAERGWIAANTTLMVLVVLNAMVRPVVAWLLGNADPPNPTSMACAVAGIAVWHAATRTCDLPGVGLRILVPVALLVALPFASASWIALTVMGLWCLRHARNEAARNAALVISAAAIRTPLAEHLFATFAGPLLRFDSLVASVFARVAGSEVDTLGNLISGDGGHHLLVMAGCASFSNISVMLLVWFTAVRLALPAGLWGVPEALAIVAAGVVANCVRIGLMTVSEPFYAFVHGPEGALLWTIFYGLIVVAAIQFSRVRRRVVDA